MLLIGLIASQARRYAYIDQKPIKALNHNADNAKLAIIAFSLPLQVFNSYFTQFKMYNLKTSFLIGSAGNHPNYRRFGELVSSSNVVKPF